MIKTSYHILHRTIVAFTLVAVIVGLLFTHKYTLVFLAEKFLKSNHIEYSKVQGTLLDGIVLYDVKYKNILRAKKIQLNYKLLSFVELKPIIKSIQTQHLFLNLDALPKNRQATQQLNLIPFIVLKTDLKNTHLIINKKEYFFHLQMKNLFYDGTFNTNSLFITLKSYYANAAIRAKIVKNKIIAHSKNVKLTKEVRSKYLHFLKGVPKQLSADLNITTQRVDLSTNIAAFNLTADNNISVHNQQLFLSYLIDRKLFTTHTSYTLTYKNYYSIINQTGAINLFGDYNSTLHVNFSNLPKNIPIKDADMTLKGNTHTLKLDANASDYTLNIDSDDYNKYKIKLDNDQLKLSFVDSLPKKLKEHQFSLHSYSTLLLSPFSLQGLFYASDTFADVSGTFHYKKHYQQLSAQIKPKLTNPFFKEYTLHSILPLQFNYIKEDEKEQLKVNANKLQAFVAKNKHNQLEGYGHYASALFTLKGDMDENHYANINLYTIIPSIKQLLQDTNLSSVRDKTLYDGEVHINSKIHIREHFSIKSTIKAPFLSAKTDSQNLYVLKDVRLRTSYKNHKINIYNYSAKYKEQRFHSNKTSQIYVDHKLLFYVEKFFIYDNLILSGVIDPLGSSMALNLHSDKFTLKTKDFNLSAKTDINIRVENTKKQIVDGNITLLSGSVFYQPQHDYTINDDDIIIIQDMQKQKQNNLVLNLHISAQNPLKYKTKEINVHFIPRITLKKAAGQKIKVYGKIIIQDGTITTQSKEFTFDKSELIFSGEKHLNPQLNVKLHFQTIDYKDIIILISNTLNSPVLIFSSNPAMSQNDIMSYILFDEPASTLFDNSSASSKASLNYLLLGTGIKTIFNKTTGIHVDTLNILNNENGTLGYEIGARLNKKIRVVYKNDISSTMILQYSLNRSFRIDVDVHDTGQGVYFIYTKDFEGF